MRRSVRLLLVVLGILGCWSGGYAQSSVGDYDPDDVIDALMLYPLPSSDIFWQGVFEEEVPDDEGVVRQIKILTVPGIITFRAYDSALSAESSIHIRVGQEYPIDNFVRDPMASDPTGGGTYDDLVNLHRQEMVGRDLIMFGSDGSYDACVRERNMVVCGFSTLSWSSTPEGGAIMGALVGLGLLLEVADSVGTTSNQRAAVSEAEPTRTMVPTRTPDLIPTLVPDESRPSRSSAADSTRVTSERQRVAAAAVQIGVIPNTSEEEFSKVPWLPSGSGTVVSPNGLILTNAHVVEEPGIALSEYLVILTSDGTNPPQPTYVAIVIAMDEILDMAVLQIVEDAAGPVDPASLQLPYVTLGNSDAVVLGDQIDIYGYPGISKGVLTFTQGVVSAFLPDRRIPGGAWIATDATISGGSSGGTAVNQRGELVGIPTADTGIECRPGDTNSDGSLNAADTGCIPVGGSLGLLRPSNLALDLLEEAGWSPLARVDVSDPGPTVTPRQTATPRPTRTPTPTLEISDLVLPEYLPLPHANCFQIDTDGAFSRQDVRARLAAAPDAEARLEEWGWQAGVYRTFGCNGPPDGEAGWVEIHIHQLGDAASAQAAVDYFADARAAGTTLFPADPPVLGVHAAVLSGPAWNGKEFTIYVSEGPLLVRVTGVSPSGIPFMNVLAVAREVLAINR